MKALKTCKTGCGKMSSGGPVKKVKKMAKGGATSKPQIYGIPQTGTTNYSAPTMKKGGATRGATDCPQGYVLVGGKCVSKIAAGIIGGGAAGMATEAIQNFRANKPVRQANRASKKAAKTTANDIANKKMGGSLKPVSADQKGLAKLPTAVRNKMGYQKKGGSVKRK